jgi:hypothetical protein
MSLSMVSCSGVSAYSKSSGTGRLPERTTATSRPVTPFSPASMSLRSPSVADMSRKVVFSSKRSGTCHATPRSLSAK